MAPGQGANPLEEDDIVHALRRRREHHVSVATFTGNRDDKLGYMLETPRILVVLVNGRDQHNRWQ